MKSILIVLTSSYLASCLPPPHPAVVQVRREEELLPLHLRSRALWNPHLQQVLPLASLLHEGEKPVFEREAEKVSRQEIYNILTHAGFLPRRPPHYQPDPHHKHHQRIKNGHSQDGHNQGGHNYGGHHQSIHHQGGQHFAGPVYESQQFGGHHPGFDQHLYEPYLGNPELLQYL